MRIDAISQVAQIYKTTQTQNSGKSQKAKAKDEVQISKLGKDFQIAKMALSDTPDTRAEKVEDIKSRMEAGTYEVSNSELADKLMEKYKDMLGL